MSDSIETRITAVLQEHEQWISWGIVDGAVWCAGCQLRIVRENFNAHVAAEVVAALGLTEETRVRTPGGISAAAFKQRRWVSGWERTE